YLLPALPPFLYFALRAVELPGRFGVALLVLSVVASIANGAAQAWSDQDPVFRHEVERRALAFAAESLRHDGRVWILGRRHTLWAQEPGPVPQDEFWNTFHFERHVAEYFVGRQLPVLPLPNGPLSAVTPRLAAQVADGDAVLRLNDVNYYTSRFPTGPHPAPLEVWSIRRLDFHATPGSPELLVDNAGASLMHGRRSRAPVHAPAETEYARGRANVCRVPARGLPRHRGRARRRGFPRLEYRSRRGRRAHRIVATPARARGDLVRDRLAD